MLPVYEAGSMAYNNFNMEQPRPQFDVLQAANEVLQEAQLVEHPVVLPPFVISDLFNVVREEHGRRIVEGIYEPFVEGGRDAVNVLQEKLALTLPATTSGFDAALPLNTPEINLVRQLLAEQRSNRNIVKETEHEQDVIAFEAAVAESGARLEPEEKRLLMKEDIERRKYNVRTSGALPLRWALEAFLEEEKVYMSPKASSEFTKDLEIGEQTLKAFQRGRKFDVDPATGKSRLTSVVLSGQQIDYLRQNLKTLKASVRMEVYEHLLDDLVSGLRHSYPTAPIVEATQEGLLKKMIKRITGHNL